MGMHAVYDFGMGIQIIVHVREVAVLDIYACNYVYNLFASLVTLVSLEPARYVYGVQVASMDLRTTHS